MNQPDRYEKFVVPEGQKKLDFTGDSKFPDAAGTLVIQREDHTLGNLVRMQLHHDNDVIFSGYRIPHPLESRLVIKVQTNQQKKPLEAVHDALSDLLEEVADIKKQFISEVERIRPQGQAQGTGTAYPMHVDSQQGYAPGGFGTVGGDQQQQQQQGYAQQGYAQQGYQGYS